MHPVLDRNVFLVKEQVGMFRAASNYDVFDPTSGEAILQCREDRLGFFTRLFRFTDYRRMMPFHLDVTTPSGEPVLSVKRPVSFFLSKVDVLDDHEQLVGGFKQKFFSVGGAFDVLGASGESLCSLKGKWTSWDFKFTVGDRVLATVSKKWAGLGKELFTSADNYVLTIEDAVPAGSPVRLLIVAAVFCIDLVLKE